MTITGLHGDPLLRDQVIPGQETTWELQRVNDLESTCTNISSYVLDSIAIPVLGMRRLRLRDIQGASSTVIIQTPGLWFQLGSLFMMPQLWVEENNEIRGLGW